MLRVNDRNAAARVHPAEHLVLLVLPEQVGDRRRDERERDARAHAQHGARRHEHRHVRGDHGGEARQHEQQRAEHDEVLLVEVAGQHARAEHGGKHGHGRHRHGLIQHELGGVGIGHGDARQKRGDERRLHHAVVARKQQRRLGARLGLSRPLPHWPSSCLRAYSMGCPPCCIAAATLSPPGRKPAEPSPPARDAASRIRRSDL